MALNSGAGDRSARLRGWLAAACLLGGLPAADADSPVWSIRGAHNTVYLAGSVHLLKPDKAALPPQFERAYQNAEALVMEIDLDDVDPLETQTWMMEHGMLQEDMTLSKVLSNQVYQTVAAEAKRLGFPMEGLDRFEPWAVGISLVQLQYMSMGYDPEHGVEKQLEQLARKDGKPIAGLETVQQQLGLFDSLSYPQQAKFLELTVEEMRDAERQTDELLEAWRAGDARKLDALLSEEYQKFPELYDALVVHRNRQWMPRIEKLLQDQKDYLVVVGALHLVGKEGLIDLARQRGLKPVSLE